MKLLLDTNAYSAFLQDGAAVTEIVHGADEVLLSAIVVGELLFGFHRGRRYEQNVAELRSFLDRPFVTFLPVGPVTAEHYGVIAAALRAKGRPIPTNDIWIAAHAVETGAELVSADRHFGYVEGLAWVSVPPGQA